MSWLRAGKPVQVTGENEIPSWEIARKALESGYKGSPKLKAWREEMARFRRCQQELVATVQKRKARSAEPRAETEKPLTRRV